MSKFKMTKKHRENLKEIKDLMGESLYLQAIEEEYSATSENISILKNRLQTKDALIKELIECVEFYGDKYSWCCDVDAENSLVIIKQEDWEELDAHGDYGGKKARTLLNSEAVKKCKAGF